MENFDITTHKNPMNAEHSEKFGEYCQLFRIVTPVIDPGDILEVEQFFSGYGKIGNAKVNFYTSDDIFKPEKSIIYHSLGKAKDGGHKFGTAHSKFNHTGICFDLSKGFRQQGWKESTYFFDVGNTPVPQVSTEMKIGGYPPMMYKLYTQKKIRPGTYTLEFNFTYFNGDRWHCDKKSIEFKVRNFLERHSTKIGVLALVASIVVILSSGVIPFINSMIEFIKDLPLK